MRVIGTAGHVDHGKSTLIAALTGIHPDRLKEEQEREMTIDLGFAWLNLPGGEMVGVVDVPGHRDFIENMLAGIGGIDAALFVVAADEGVMPQTREHLSILDLLQIQAGVIVLTKTDLVDDPEWLEMVTAEIRQVTDHTVLEEAPIVQVSARTGMGLEELKTTLSRVLSQEPARVDLGKPRLPVDRVFTMAGFGTVVTGTLSNGSFHVGEEIEILPGGLRGRIRGLQTHKQKEDIAFPGSRTAINISGISLGQIERGDVVVLPGTYLPTAMLDVQFRHLREADGPLRHNSEVKFFLGAAELLARVRVLGAEEIRPGEEGWLQLELSQPVVAVRSDRYILRRPSPGETLGGGAVIDPFPKERHKRFSTEVLSNLRALSQGAPMELILQASQSLGITTIKEVYEKAHLHPETGESILNDLVTRGELLLLDDPGASQNNSLVISREQWAMFENRIIGEIQAYLKTNTLRKGMPREQLKSRLKLGGREFNAVLSRLSAETRVAEAGALVSLPGYEVHLTSQQEANASALMAKFSRAPFSPPSIKECQAEIGDELFSTLVEMGELVPVSNEVVFRQSDYRVMVEEVRQRLVTKGTLTVAQFRDLFNTSRRYALAFLEHLDNIGVTVREGDLRRLRR